MNTFDHAVSLLHTVRQRFPSFDIPSLQIGDITAKLPIVQGGMGVGISLSGLASAAANQGGIGTIAANAIGLLEPDYFKDGMAANIRALRREIRKAKALTPGTIAVNIMVALKDFSQLVQTAIEERADMIVMGAGLPIKNIPVMQMRKFGIKVIPIVSSSRAANLIFSMWKRIYKDVPDAVIVEGPEAGGHLGFTEEELANPAYSLEKLVVQVADTLKPYTDEFSRRIPIIAGGGLYTGEDIYRIMQYGADGVQMGTRFVATHECDADIRFKQAYVNCSKKDICIIKSPVGMPGRAIRNSFLEKAELSRRTFSCPWQCLAGCRADEAHYCISLALNNARLGNLDRGFVFAGSNAYRIKRIVSTASLMRSLVLSYAQAKMKDVLSRDIDYVHAQTRFLSIG